MTTLHLILKSKWYDMIASGEKKEEYREISPYYIKRLSYGIDKIEEQEWMSIKHFDNVCFHLGYSCITMKFKIDCIKIGYGNPEWGAEPEKQYFVIKLGERI